MRTLRYARPEGASWISSTSTTHVVVIILMWNT